MPDNIKNNISLDLIGEPYPDYLHQLQEFIQVNDISEQINFLGYCSNVAELLCNYDMGITVGFNLLVSFSSISIL